MGVTVLAALAGVEVWPQRMEWPDSTARDPGCEAQQCRPWCLGVVLAALVISVLFLVTRHQGRRLLVVMVDGQAGYSVNVE